MSWQYALMLLCLGLAAVCGLITYVAWETRKPKKNIRLPRRVSWDRASKYYYGDTE